MADSNNSSGRCAGRKYFWTGLCVLAVLLVMGMGYVTMLATRRWGDVLDRRGPMLREVYERPAARSVLRGKAVPGSAWDDYRAALDLCREANLPSTSDAKLGAFITRSKDADRSAVEKILASHWAAIEHLRLGAQRAEGQYPYQWELGSRSPSPPALILALKLSHLCVCQARLWREDGHFGDAAMLLLDLCQYARDSGYNGNQLSLIEATYIYQPAFEELRDLVVSGKLSKEELTEVGRELEIVDRLYPRQGDSFLNERLYFFEAPLALSEFSQSSFGNRLKLWRYGFSYRLAAAALVELEDQYAAERAGCDLKSWEEVEKTLETRLKEIENRLVEWYDKQHLSYVLVSVRAQIAGYRIPLAQLRLLRTAVSFLATGEFLELADPFGKKLHHSKEGGKVRIWSNGLDGKDDGGKGEWKPTTRDPGRDIVLEFGS